MISFDSLPLRPETRAALVAMAVSTPTPIQVAAVPLMLDGRDVIGQARTGSGKTLAFVLPLIERLDDRRREVQALVLVPTRELAAQVAGVVRDAARGRALRTLLLVGGTAPSPQRLALRRGVHVVVGTPGRVLDHLNQGALRLDRLRLLVLDEGDEMLDRGFAPDVERLIAATNPARQTALFSATVPDWVNDMAARHLRRPVSVRVDVQAQPVEHVLHTVYDVPEGSKPAALRALLDARKAGVTLVFGRTKHGVTKLARQLQAAGYPVAALQGNLSQNARDRVMAEFRSGALPILVATNVAARGLDVAQVAQVINYELPETAALLTHRVGRTGRMGRRGEAITLLTRSDEPVWRKLLRDLHRHPVRRPWRGSHEPAPAHQTEQSQPKERTAAAVPAPSSASGERPLASPPFGGRRTTPSAVERANGGREQSLAPAWVSRPRRPGPGVRSAAHPATGPAAPATVSRNRRHRTPRRGFVP